MAKHPACLSLVFWFYRQAADSGDVVIQEQYIAIVDTREPMSATPFLFLHIHHNPCGNLIFLEGHHQGAYRLMSPGLHPIESVNGRCEMLHKTYIGWLIPRQSREVQDFPPSAILPSGNLLGLETQGE
jgi:hypothetical protein